MVFYSPVVLLPPIESSPVVLLPPIESSPVVLLPPIESSPVVLLPPIESSPVVLLPPIESSPVVLLPPISLEVVKDVNTIIKLNIAKTKNDFFIISKIFKLYFLLDFVLSKAKFCF